MGYKNAFLVYTESANYVGYGEYYVVNAISKEDAEEQVKPEAESYFYEQDYGLLLEDFGEDGVNDVEYSSIVSVEEFNPEHPDWAYKEEFTHI